MKRVLDAIKLLFGWPLSLVAIFFIAQRILSKKEIISLKPSEINFQALIYGVICFGFYFFLKSYVWQRILKEKGYSIPLKESIFLWEYSELKRYVPGNIWSFLGRALLFSEKGVTKRVIASSLLIEIEYFLLSNLTLSILATSFISYNLLSDTYPIKLINYLIILFSSIGIIFYIFNNLILNRYLNFKPFTILKHILPDFSPRTNLSLYIIALFYSFFFALGTYLSISSLIYLNPIYIFTYIGLFNFSLLVGYLSLVTPMGLGVREGVIALGLAKFASFSLAGLAAIYTRVILMFSEFIFLIFTYFWRTTENKFVLNLENFIRKNKQQAILLLLIVIYIIYFINLSFLRYDNYYTGRFDLGNMDQTVWNTLNGRFFQQTDPNGTEIISRLSFHADFFLILLTPFYYLWSNPKTLLIIQTLVLAIGAIFVFLIAQKILKNKNLALLLGAMYLLNPCIQYANLFDFHSVTLATTFILAMYYFLIRGNIFFFIVFAILAGLTKEQLWLVVSFFGIYICFISTFLKKAIKDRYFFSKTLYSQIFGLSVFFISFSIAIYIISIAIPNARGSNHFALEYYSDFGNSPITIVKNIILSPQKTFKIIIQPDRINYLYQVLLPFGFLPLLSPLFLIFTIPDFFINLLSNNSQLRQIYFQYNAAIIPFLFISTIYALKKIKKMLPNFYFGVYVLFLVIPSLYSTYLYGPMIGAKSPNLDMVIKPQPDREIIDDFISNIPQKYSIAATNNLGSHLSHRQKIFTIPVGIDKADIVLFLLNDPFAQPSLEKQKEITLNLKKNKDYIEIFKNNDFIVFEKRNLYLKPASLSEKELEETKLFPLSIPALQHRDYTGGDFVIENIITTTKLYTSYIISYQSDGLKLYSLMNIPNTNKPINGYPVIVLNHGYINPRQYSSVYSYFDITDYFSSRGFIVLKPDYRGHAMSEADDGILTRFSYPIDVLNLISSIKEIKEADHTNIFLFGHSMGGEVTLKVLEILNSNKELPQGIKAAAVWAPVTDPIRWFNKTNLKTLPEATITPFPYAKTFGIIGTPEKNPTLWQSLSPLKFLSNIKVPILINHGTEDKTVPYEWSIELYDDLISLNKNAKLVLFPENDHNFSKSWDKAAKETVDFFIKNFN